MDDESEPETLDPREWEAEVELGFWGVLVTWSVVLFVGVGAGLVIAYLLISTW